MGNLQGCFNSPKKKQDAMVSNCLIYKCQIFVCFVSDVTHLFLEVAHVDMQLSRIVIAEMQCSKFLV